MGLNLGSGPRPKPPKKINSMGLDSEFNSIHFGIEINKCLKFLGPKNERKILENFFKEFQICHKFLGLKNFTHLLISLPNVWNQILNPNPNEFCLVSNVCMYQSNRKT
jgi:hypothetical protein